VTLYEIINVGVRDVIEIALVAYLLYQLYRLMRGTIAVQIAFGLGALFLIQVVVELANMTMLSTIFSYFNQVFVLAVIIIFQPEIRRLLLLLGKNPIVRRFVSTTDRSEIIDETVTAVEHMAERNIGALIAFQRSTGLRSYAVGLTEQTDAFVVVVSEETGNISVSRDGALISNITPDELQRYLTKALTNQPSATASSLDTASA